MNKINNTEDLIDYADRLLGVNVAQEIKEIIRDVNPQLHEFVQMANVCIEILERNNEIIDHNDELTDAATSTLIQLMKSMATYGYKTSTRL